MTQYNLDIIVNIAVTIKLNNMERSYMTVKRVVRFNIKKNHVDYDYIKQQLIESKEIYNYANYIIRQIFLKSLKTINIH